MQVNLRQLIITSNAKELSQVTGAKSYLKKKEKESKTTVPILDADGA